MHRASVVVVVLSLSLLSALIGATPASAGPLELVGTPELYTSGDAVLVYELSDTALTLSAESRNTLGEIGLAQLTLFLQLDEGYGVTFTGMNLFEPDLSIAEFRMIAEDPRAPPDYCVELLATTCLAPGALELRTWARPGLYQVNVSVQSPSIGTSSSLAFTLQATPIPEPRSLALALAGGALVAGSLALRRRSARAT